MTQHISLIVAILTAPSTGAEIAANDAVRAYHTLCAVVALAKGKPVMPEDVAKQAITEDINLLHGLNITASHDFLYGQNFKQVEGKVITETNWIKYGQKWEEAKTKLEESKLEINGLKILRPKWSHATKTASAIINRSLEMALQLEGQYEDPAKDNDAPEEMKKALYGETGKQTSTAGETFADSGSNSCAAPGTGDNKPGISLASDPVCICSDSAGKNQGNSCLGKNGGANVIYTNAATANTGAAQLVNGCPYAKDTIITPGAIATFGSGIKDAQGTNQAEHVVLGAKNQHACNGAITSGCIKYLAPVNGEPNIP
uniref:Variant surface glycoprotein 1125.1502 n=1 Tax=Trypanosoma brucei TaxID=5691 RepID=A0A1J0R759_9TRYP|nr:variant surface glycoprotein 1125.1502 [Trypanosoma brucei]